MAAIHLCELDYFPWNKQKMLVKKIKKLTLLQSVYPNWAQLWQFVGDCFQVGITYNFVYADFVR